MIDKDDPQVIPDYFASNIENFIIRNRGQLEMRDGLTARGVSPAASNLGAAVLYEANQLPLFIRVINGAANSSKFQKSSDGATWTDISGGGSRTTDAKWAFAQANNALYGVNGTDTSVKITNSGLSTIAAIPKGIAIEWWKNFMWVIGVSGSPDVLYFSNANTPETWTGSDVINVNLGDSSPGTGLRGLGGATGRMIVGKERSMWYVSGSSGSNFALQPLTFQHGIVNQESMISFGNDIWGVDTEANIWSIYKTDSDNIFTSLKSSDLANTIAGINKTSISTCSAVVFDNYALFFMPNGVDSHNSIVLVWDKLANEGKGGWSKFTGWNIARAVVFDDNQPRLFLFDSRSGNGQAYEWDGTSDNGQSIVAKYETKVYDHGVPERRKRWRYSYQYAPAQGAVNMRYYTSVDRFYYTLLKTFSLVGTGNKLLGSTWTLGVDKLGSGGFVQQYIGYTDNGGNDTGFTIQTKLEAESSTAKIKIRNFTSHYRVLGLR